MAIFRQLADRISFSVAQEKGISIVLRTGAVILAILTLNRLHK
jgi:hypothetical protein